MRRRQSTRRRARVLWLGPPIYTAPGARVARLADAWTPKEIFESRSSQHAMQKRLNLARGGKKCFWAAC